MNKHQALQRLEKYPIHKGNSRIGIVETLVCVFNFVCNSLKNFHIQPNALAYGIRGTIGNSLKKSETKF